MARKKAQEQDPLLFMSKENESKIVEESDQSVEVVKEMMKDASEGKGWSISEVKRKALAFKTTGESPKILVIPVDTIERVLADHPEAEVCYVGNVHVKHSFAEVLDALGWEVTLVK